MLAKKAAAGDIRAAQELADRAEGRARQAIEIEHTRLGEAFERMSREELEAYAVSSALPEWFPKANNYFGLTAGPAFKGTIGTYTASTCFTFGVYPAPGLLNSGMSFANSFQGARVAGSQTIQQYGNALTTGPKAFNSTDPNYLNNLKARYNQVIALGGC